MVKKEYKILQPPSIIGIIGGGQLGRMITVEAKRMGYRVIVLDPTPSSPAGQVADEEITASFTDRKALRKLANECDVLTYEFENIDSDILLKLEEEGYRIYPSGNSLKKIQDKLIQKTILSEAGLPVPDFFPVTHKNDITDRKDLTFPFVLKTRSGGYDGKGNYVIKNIDDIEEALEAFKGRELLAEEFIAFEREISIICARGLDDACIFYPVVENVHEESILKVTRAPAYIDEYIENKVKEIALKVVDVLNDYGVFCIEMFLLKDGRIFINEIAPRPHNSGHYTIEACVTSQFEQLVRIITGMPLGSTKMRSPSVMVNVLGSESVKGQYRFEGIDNVLCEEDVHLHLYGKHSTKRMKKIGHITVLDKSLDEAENKALCALNKLKIKPL